MARKGITIETELVSVTRLYNSVNGNGRFRLNTLDGEYVTQSDSACSYDVENIARKIHAVPVPVTLQTTPAGRVWDIRLR